MSATTAPPQIVSPGADRETPGPSSDGAPSLQTIDLARVYGDENTGVAALRGVDLTVNHGEFLVVLGRSGSGKSTLLSLLGLLDRPTGGRYLIGGQDSADFDQSERAILRNQSIGFVFQQFHLLRRYTAAENVELPLIYAGVGPAERTRRAAEALAVVGLKKRMTHWPSQLSGGEQQRVAIARAIVNRPRVLLADEPTGALDTATNRQIMQLLQKLNAAGQTIVMVTHDIELARYGDRAILMRDGSIVDTVTVKSRQPGKPPARWQHRTPQSRAGADRLQEAFSSASRMLRANPIRSIFTTLGIVVGIAAIIAMVAIGDGARSKVADQIRSLGTNLLLVMPGSSSKQGVQQGLGSRASLTQNDAEAIARQIKGVQVAVPAVTGRGQVVHGSQNWSTLIGGVDLGYLFARDWKLARGSPFSTAEVRSAAKVALIGATVAKRLFGVADPLGQIVRIRKTPFRVKGVLATKGQNAASGRDQDDVVLIPLSTAKLRILGRSGIDRRSVDFILVKSEDGAIETMPGHVTALLRKRHRLPPAAEADFVLRDPAASLEARQDSLQSLTMLLFAVAAVSLLVGGIGIMNIMLVSTTERRPEIGLRMAVGATPADIRNQFIIEAATLCLLGSVAGILLGAAAAAVIAWISDWPILIRIGAILLAVLSASLTGICFGFYPAHKASRMRNIHSELG